MQRKTKRNDSLPLSALLQWENSKMVSFGTGALAHHYLEQTKKMLSFKQLMSQWYVVLPQ
jgi:hypothetical protein